MSPSSFHPLQALLARFEQRGLAVALAVAAASVALMASAPARAHLDVLVPESRYAQSVQKSPPCGMGDGPRTDTVTVYEPGETIEVQWDEYINHPSHYRISFDPDGQDDFADPECLENCDSRDMVIEEYSNDAVLLDGIEDGSGGMQSVSVTLPDIECDNCTLQVIQVMYDKPPYEIGGNDIYYQCADLVLRRAGGDGGVALEDASVGSGDADAGVVDEPDAGGGSMTGEGPSDTGEEDRSDGGSGRARSGAVGGTGCATVGGDGGGPLPLLGLLGLAAIGLRRRRRRGRWPLAGRGAHRP